MQNISILLVDDHKLFRAGLKLLLENITYIHRVDEAENGIQCLNFIRQFTPDIVFMDIEMPEMDGIAATRKALELFPELKIIALSIYGDENYYTNMIRAGAKGFVLKNSSIKDVEDAIKNVCEGNNYVSPEILNRLLKGIEKKGRHDLTDILSEREKEVLYHICKGLSNQDIANILYLSKRTVDKHRENLLNKTNSKNTAGLVMYAIKNGIVDL